VNYKDKLQAIEEEKWPEPVKARARELLKTTFQLRVNKAKLKGKLLYSLDTPAILLESGRLLQRLGENYKALAAEVAFFKTMER